MLRCVRITMVALLALQQYGCKDQRKPQKRLPTSPADVESPAVTDAPTGRMWTFASAAEALDFVLERDKPKVIGFGEIHELQGGPAVASSVQRFRKQLLPRLIPRLKHLVLETWVYEGRCGAIEKRIQAQVTHEIQRPKHTASELEELIRALRTAGVRPHPLRWTCEDYEKLGHAGKLDIEQLLILITQRLGSLGERVYAQRAPTEDSLTAIYAGEMHNALVPHEAVADLSFGPRLDRASAGGYVEVDLFVPEFIDNNKRIATRDWFQTFRDKSTETQVLLFSDRPRSYALIFKRGIAAAPPRD